VKRKSSKKTTTPTQRHGHRLSSITPVPDPNRVVDSLIGWWGFYLSGTTPLKQPQSPPRPPPMYLRPLAMIGRTYFNGSGILSSYFSINHNGTAQEIPYANRITGRYAINSDLATGYLQFPPTDALKLGSTMSFVLTNGGNEMFLLSMEPSWPRSLDEAIEPLAGICFYGIAKRG
jgi:hypothetical protein